jgi:hypothetical protein
MSGPGITVIGTMIFTLGHATHLILNASVKGAARTEEN